MTFTLQRHIRAAGALVIILGVIFTNWTLMLLGWCTVIIGYQAVIHKIEKYFEEKDKENAIHPPEE